MIQQTIYRIAATVAFAIGAFGLSHSSHAQNYERYKPLEIPQKPLAKTDLPEPSDLPKQVEDDRVLVASLDAVVIVDRADKIIADRSIDDFDGIHYDFVETESLVYKPIIRSIIAQQLGQPITLRRINELSRDIIKQYRYCKQPIVDVLIPEQRITGGTLHIVVIESRIGKVVVEPGCYFDCEETKRWIECTRTGDRIFESKIENDLFWMNRNPFAQVGVDFKKGSEPGTTDIVYNVDDTRPIRGYMGIDDSGVETLNFGRFFAGFQYGNFLGRGGTLGYQFTTDEEFRLLEAHSVSFTQAINRDFSFLTYGSWAGVSPTLDLGLSQDGESYQHGTILTRHLEQTRQRSTDLTAGYEFKATNNNLEFDGTTISDSTADLLQLRFGFRDFYRTDIDQFGLFSIDAFIGPGGGLTGHHSTAAFNSIRPGTSPDYIYARMRYQRQRLFAKRWLLSTNFVGQASSERLLFSETLGLGGFDSIRGTDQREYNADHGWIANFELGPSTHQWGDRHDPRSLRAYTFLDLGNGYIDDPIAGEDSTAFAASTGFGLRLQVSDRITARFDYGFGIDPITANTRDDRAHFGLTWIPGRRF